MADDSLRRRLEALNRAPITSPVRESAPGEAASAAGRVSTQVPDPHTIPTANVRSPFATARAIPSAVARLIPGLLQQGCVVQTQAGEHLRICLPLEVLWPGGDSLVAGRLAFLREQLAVARQSVNPTVIMTPDFEAFVAALPARTLLLDLETCGLAGAALFLVGVLRQIDGTPTVELLLARNYAEEAAVLTSLWRLIDDHDVLVTFNGKTFDWPMVLERSVRHRLTPVGWAPPTTTRNQDWKTMGGTHPTNLMHLDVLHHARRRWRKQLPDCRLQTLERFVCRRHRPDDIPGHRIPSVYADFVRTGFDRDMNTVLYHNAVDLITLFDLSLRLAE